ncbi:MAG: acyltransferase family protein [Muricomes sp.]
MKYFDIAKGIAMICIIIGHLGIVEINSFVFTFHVPVFFLISGFFLNDKLTLSQYVKQKKSQLLIPYMVTCIFTIIGATLSGIMTTRSTENVVESIKTWTIASIYGSGTIEYTSPFYIKQIGALWFLLALFTALIIVRYFMSYQYGAIAILFITYVGYKTTEFIWLPFSIQAGMTASLFIYMGFLFKKHKIFDRTIPAPILGVMVAIWLFCIVFCGKFYMVRNYYGSGFLDILGALCGSYLVIMLSKSIENNTKYISGILNFYGKNSLFMMCFHAFELNIISWNWVWTIFGERLQFQYFTVVCIIIFMKILFCTAGILGILQLQKLYKLYWENIGKLYNALKSKFQEISKTDIDEGRVQYWDIAKGAAILLMILGHTDIPQYLRVIIFSFHMPLFVIVNGYFIKSYDIKRTFTRSVKTLLYPYGVTCVLSAVIYTIIGGGGENNASLFLFKIKAMLGGMSKISTRFQEFDSVWVVWFVCCLFITRNVYVILMHLLEKYSDSYKTGAIVAIAVAGYFIGKYYAFMPWSLDVALVALIFIAFGDWLRKTNFLEKGYFYTLFLPAAAWIYFLRLGIHIELSMRDYPLGIFSFVEAIAASIVVITLSRMLDNGKLISKGISWFGKNSMLILAVHCLELMYMNWNELIYRFLPFTMNWFRIFVIKTVVIVLVVVLFNEIKKCLRAVSYKNRYE